MTLIPAPFLFRFTVPVSRMDKLPRGKAPLLKLPASCHVPFPSILASGPDFARLALAWNPQGLVVEVTVEGKKQPVYGDQNSEISSDSVRIWIDTRDTQNQHRGSRFCHHFIAQPMGGGDTGTEPVFRQLPVPRAREEAPFAEEDLLLPEAEITSSGYRLSLWFPRESLHGFDPGPGTRLGFYLVVHDRELGQQVLTVTDDFPYESDPSQWVSLELEST